MKFTIISIDDSRRGFKDAIRRDMAGVNEVSIECLDARPTDLDLNAYLASIGLKMAPFWLHQQWKRGDIGGFVGHYNAWRKCVELDEPLVVFEDDAIIPKRDSIITDWIAWATDEVPDWEFLSLCANSYGQMFYDQRVIFDGYGYHKFHQPLQSGEANQFDASKLFARVYQPWTLTAAVYTPKSARHLIKMVQEVGIFMNADAFVMHQARLQRFIAYAPKPEHIDHVVQFNEGHSIIQSAEA